MRLPRGLTSFVLLAVPGAAGAQPPAKEFTTRAATSTTSARRSRLPLAEQMRRHPDILTGDVLSGVASELATGRRTLGETVLMSSDEKTFYIYVHRTENSRPEVHARWDDLVLVKSGTGAIELGDSLVGSEYRATGERIGGRFHRSYQVVIRPGDIVRIPAVVPHAFIVSGKEPLDYLVIKQRRPELPVRWTNDR
jgi:mannose-6-phosphate isomerase-like protein (cupin superfamily)